MFFNQVIGHTALKEQLKKAAQTDRVSQAMLFLGNEGVGALPLALALAQYLNCENPNEEDSCGTCSSCVKSQKLAHPDIHYTYPSVKARAISKDYITEWREAVTENPYMSAVEWIAKLDNANKQGNITAEECQQIIRQHALRHFEGKYKIQIIWMAEMLGKEGNKLLKIIEEPPANTVFILIATSDKAILPTILSRTQLIKLSPLSLQEIEDTLVERKNISREIAQKIAPLAEGNWNLAKEMIEESESNFFENWQRWMQLVVQKSNNPSLATIQGLVTWVDEISGIGRQNQKLFLKYIMFYLRETLILHTGLPLKITESEQKLAKYLTEKISIDEIAQMSDIINNLHYQIIRNANPKIGFMNASVEISTLLSKRATVSA